MNTNIKPIAMNKSSGFTLIEVLVAMVVFAILGTLSTYAMQKLLQSYAIVKQQHVSWEKLDNVFFDLDKKLKHFVRRPISAQSNRQFPAMIGQPDYLEWTYAAENEHLKRIAVLCHNHQLVLRQWPVLDTLDRNRYHENVLIDKLSHCQFRYLDRQGKIIRYWQSNAKKSPKGVELTLEWGPHQSINLWFNMAPNYYVA
jgi:general secretion pathway protein J